MGIMNPPVDPANVVQALVYTLLDVFDATRDLHQTLRAKERRDVEKSLWAKGYLSSRRSEYMEDDERDGDMAIVTDKSAVTRRFEIGFQEIGAQFAIGDVVSQTALQSQIITLQSVIITTFLYGPTSTEPIPHQLASLVAASRAAGQTAVDVLAAQNQRQLAALPVAPQSARQSPAARSSLALPPPYPVTVKPSSSSASTALVKSRHEPTVLPAKTTILDTDRPRPTRSDTESTSFSGPTSYGAQSHPHTLYCLYALDLQKNSAQPLSTSITSSSSPYCPHCQRSLHLSPGKSWEVFKEEGGAERCFRIQNRFVVKCHRDGADGGYSCVLCTRSASVDTVCGDVKALIRHVWMDHSAAELEVEEDVAEVVEAPKDQRRDSGTGWGDSRSIKRSQSLGPGRHRGRRRFEMEVETFEIRVPRRDAMA